MKMTTSVRASLMLVFISKVYSAITIPDKVPAREVSLVMYTKPGSWYQADRVCRAKGGFLVLVDGPEIALRLQELEDQTGSSHEIHTRMVRHDDQKFYSHDTQCGLVNTTNWDWENPNDATWDADKQCVLAKSNTFRWEKKECSHDDEFVCENQGGILSGTNTMHCHLTFTGSRVGLHSPDDVGRVRPILPKEGFNVKGLCGFVPSSVSLASLPVSNASMAVCQATCRQMIGCFATAPSGHATLPPFTHCLFVVTGDNSNPMTNVECDHQYTADDITNAKEDPYTADPADPDKDPVDCVPGQTGAGVYHTEQRSLKDFMQESNTSRACNQTDINPSPVVETAYVTLTPNVVTDYVTLTPEMQTVHVTMTMSPDVQTAYVTVTPAIQTAYVTLTQEMPTAYVTVTQSGYDVVTTTVDRAVPTTVAQTVTVTESSSQACSYSDNSVAPATVSQTATVVQTQNVTQTQTQTLTQTQVVTQTQIISASTVCEPQPSSYPCSNTTNNTETGTYEEQRTEEQIRLDLEALLKDLAINRNNVSRSRRKKESALDERKSAQTIGAAAVAFLVVAALLIAGMDISTLFRKIFSLRSAVAAKSSS